MSNEVKDAVGAIARVCTENTPLPAGTEMIFRLEGLGFATYRKPLNFFNIPKLAEPYIRNGSITNSVLFANKLQKVGQSFAETFSAILHLMESSIPLEKSIFSVADGEPHLFIIFPETYNFETVVCIHFYLDK